MLLITASTSDELFSRIKIDDFERLCSPKIRGFVVFFLFLAAAHMVCINLYQLIR